MRAIGRPANDGMPGAWCTLLECGGPDAESHGLAVEFVRVAYDRRALAREMRDAKLPEAFAETIETGWWTTCLENMLAKERSRGRH